MEAFPLITFYNFNIQGSSQLISYSDLRLDEKDGFSTSEVEFFKEQLSAMDKNMKEYITNPNVTPIERYDLEYR